MGRRRGFLAGRAGSVPADTDLGGWLQRAPKALLRAWIRAAGGRPADSGAAGLAAALEAIWGEGGGLAKAVESCPDEARAVLDGIAEHDFEVPVSGIATLLAGRDGRGRASAQDVRRAVDPLERAGLVVRLRDRWQGDTVVVLPPVWHRVRDRCRPPLRLPEDAGVSADDHPNRYGPGALAAAALGRVAQRPIRVTRAGHLHRKDRERVAGLLGDYLGDDDEAVARLDALVVSLHGAGLLAVRGDRLCPDLAAVDAFAGAAPERRALRLLATAGHQEPALGRAAVRLLETGGAWCAARTLLADAGWRPYDHGPPERGVALLADLGLAEAGTAADGTRALRATAVLLAAAGGASETDAPGDAGSPPGSGPPRAVVQADFKVLAPENLPLGWLAGLAVHADLVRSDRMWVLELSPASVRRVAESGAPVEATLDLLARAAGGEERLPGALAQTLRGFAERCPGARLVRGPVFFFDGPEAADAAAETLRSISPVRRAAPAALEVADPMALDRACRVLRRAGYAVSDPGERGFFDSEFGPPAGDGDPEVASLADLRARFREADPTALVPPTAFLLPRLQGAVVPGGPEDAGRPGRATAPAGPFRPPPPASTWAEPEPAELPPDLVAPGSAAVVPAAIRNLIEDAIDTGGVVAVKGLDAAGRIYAHEVVPIAVEEERGGVLHGVDLEGRRVSLEVRRIVEARSL